MKYKIMVFLVIVISHYLSAQNYIEYESFGFNTIELVSWDGGISRNFFMVNNPLYSTMKIWGGAISNMRKNEISTCTILSRISNYKEWWLHEERHDDETGYSLNEWYIEHDHLPHHWNRMENGGFLGPQGLEIRYITDQNKRLVTVEGCSYNSSGDQPISYKSQNVRYHQDGSITVDLDNNRSMRFLNIPEQEIIDIYLTAFVKTVHENINGLSWSILEKRTIEELAIIRNILFAKYNFAFKTHRWKSFMRRYYDPNYEGKYSNQEVMNKFTRKEEYLLESILKLERRKVAIYL
ncbi:MAG: YARHG domain-containing protein [Treponema sp.]|nr:YARHG domain-containing protein [Treponema sp.]